MEATEKGQPVVPEAESAISDVVQTVIETASPSDESSPPEVEKLEELPAQKPGYEGGPRYVPTQRRELAAFALKELWHILHIAEEAPLIFPSPLQRRVQLEHHPLLLEQLIASGKSGKGAKQRKKPVFGQLKAWEMLRTPPFAQGIAATHEVNVLLKADMLRPADIGERNVVPSAPYGWICYTFSQGWKALSVYFHDPDSNETCTLHAVPFGHQDEWLAFLKLLDELHDSIWRNERRGSIEVIGGGTELADTIKQVSYEDIILPPATLTQVIAQRRIFDKEILTRYAALHLPRLRKALLIGPPGTGKTTLLKAEGAYHARQGGAVFYVSSPPYSRQTTPWHQLSLALHMAAESQLPSLVLVEDFELFVSNPSEMPIVLNTLDGINTPDNPAGTLLLATTNDPEKIDARIRDRTGRIDVLIEIGPVEEIEQAKRLLAHFLGDAYREEEHAAVAAKLLKFPGSHFREICIAGTMHALEHGRSDVLNADLLWAHEMVLTGKSLVEETERYSPITSRKRGAYFGKNQ